jgi:glutaredoxin 3
LKVTGGRTVPRVFINGKCIGGGDDTAKMEKDGKLKPLLDSIQALD